MRPLRGLKDSRQALQAAREPRSALKWTIWRLRRSGPPKGFLRRPAAPSGRIILRAGVKARIVRLLADLLEIKYL
jgi:hypothetical protein